MRNGCVRCRGPGGRPRSSAGVRRGRPRRARYGMMYNGTMRAREVRRRSRFGMMQGLRGVQRCCADGPYAEEEKYQGNEPNAGQFHPANILSTMEFVPHVRPGAPHFTPSSHALRCVFLRRRPGNPFLLAPAVMGQPGSAIEKPAANRPLPASTITRNTEISLGRPSQHIQLSGRSVYYTVFLPVLELPRPTPRPANRTGLALLTSLVWVCWRGDG